MQVLLVIAAHLFEDVGLRPSLQVASMQVLLMIAAHLFKDIGSSLTRFPALLLPRSVLGAVQYRCLRPTRQADLLWQGDVGRPHSRAAHLPRARPMSSVVLLPIAIGLLQQSAP